MAYLSEITLSTVIKREKFKNALEALSYLQDRYPDLLIDEEQVHSYFPCESVSPLESEVGVYLNGISRFQKDLVIVSEFLLHFYTMEKMVLYLKKKYPNMYVSIAILKSAYHSKMLPSFFASEVQERLKALQYNRTSVSGFFFNQSDRMKPLLAKLLYRHQFSKEQIAQILEIDVNKIVYSKPSSFRVLNKEEFVQAFCEKQKQYVKK